MTRRLRAGPPGRNTAFPAMTELVRHYLTEDQEELHVRSEKAADRLAEYKKLSRKSRLSFEPRATLREPK